MHMLPQGGEMAKTVWPLGTCSLQNSVISGDERGRRNQVSREIKVQCVNFVRKCYQSEGPVYEALSDPLNSTSPSNKIWLNK